MPPPESSPAAGRFTTENRFLFLEMKTPVGDLPPAADKLLLESFVGHEGISQLFHFELDLVSEDRQIDFDRITGQEVTFGVRLAGGRKPRVFHGVVARFAQLPDDERLAHYRAEVVPRLWFLTRTADCRIYQRRTTPTAVEIISDVLHRHGVVFRNEIRRKCSEREYTVQYRETALNFITRLMEEEGVVYFFEHASEQHTLVLTDATASFAPCPEQSSVPYQQATGSRVLAAAKEGEEDVIVSWQQERELRSGKYSVADYNFTLQAASFRLFADSDTMYPLAGNTGYEIYDYPGGFDLRPQGEQVARLRMEEEETPRVLIRGQGTCRAFRSGFKFTLTGHGRKDQNRGYTLTRVDHRAQEADYYSQLGGGENTYQNRFCCVPDDVKIRPARITPRPVVHGSQTAVVVGPKDEEIYTDKFGRVKVQFHWDRLGQYDENSSCWIRVSQPWAGNRWGAIALPRVGQEVIVDFLEGDPDRPVITGRVYNAANMPPYELPADKTITTFKSYSKGGGGYNELLFEDLKGQEMVFLHAEKDEHIRVGRNVVETVGDDRHLIVRQSQFEWASDQCFQVKGDRHEKIGYDLLQSIGHSSYRSIGTDAIQRVGQNLSIQAGANVVIDAGQRLTLQVGASFISIDRKGIAIQGPMVYINSPSSGQTCAPVLPCFPPLEESPQEAIDMEAGKKAELPPPLPPARADSYGATARAFQEGAETGQAIIIIEGSQEW